MITLPIFLCVLTVARAGPRPDYTEDQIHYPEQKLSAMTNLTEALFVKKRNYNTTTAHRCLSAKKIGDLGDDKYNYTLKARVDGHYFSYPVTMTGSTTGGHKEHNAVTYPESPSEPETLHKIVTMNKEHTCFVLARDNGASHVKECFMAMTKDAAEKDIPEQCENVYKTYCPGNSITLYEQGCEA
uniref:Lipocalin n=1 Tax=Rhipicephalus zambeziensis TaxID=60191 RepID=A0A224YCQ7_9ACAR